MAAQGYVLHLARAGARRANAQALLDTLRNCGLAAELWPAVDGAAMSAAELRRSVSGPLFAPAYPFALRTGEIGCFLSHREIWAETLRRATGPALIVEDDAAIDGAVFATALGLALSHIEDLGYIQFQTRAPRGPAALIDSAGGSALCVPRRSELRTTAQMISPAAAERLLRLSERIDRPVDTFVQSHWHTGLRAAAIHPSGVSDIAGALEGSTIQGGGRRRPPLERLAREWARARYRMGAARLARQSPAPAPGGTADEG